MLKPQFLLAAFLATALLSGFPEPGVAASLPSVAIGDASVGETAHTVYFPVVLSQASSAPVSVKWTTQDATALTPSDYTGASGQIRFAPGQTRAQVRVLVRDDKIEEADEKFRVVLAEPQNARISRSTGIVSVADDDYAGTVGVNDVRGVEDNSGTRPFGFKVSLSTPPMHALKLYYATQNGSARATSDYVSTSGTLIIKVRQQKAVVNVSVVGDTDIEPDETFSLKIGAPNVTFSDALAIATIENDDKPVPLPSTIGRIVFASRRTHSSEIYIVNADGSNETRLTNDHDEDGTPTLSPDGKRIAFASQRYYEDADIYLMNTDGSAQTRLTNNSRTNFSPSFSPDGRTIIFASLTPNVGTQIYSMSADGSNQKPLTFNAALDDRNPVFSPDGRTIAFVSTRNGNYATRTIYLMSAEGSNVRSITDAVNQNDEPAFSPDGKKIVFSSGGRDGSRDIFAINTDGTNFTQLTRDGASASPAFSPDGSTIVFSGKSDSFDDAQLCVMSADGSNRRPLAKTYGSGAFWARGFVPVPPAPVPAPSTSGKMAFTSYRGGNNVDVYAMNADGSNQTRLTTNNASDFDPCFSPDGSKIVFSSTREADGDIDIFVMNADGTGQMRLTTDKTQELSPAFSPDGSRIIYGVSSSNKSDIYVMNADGTNQRRLTNNGARNGGGRFSPDGSRIVFASDLGGELQIFVMNADGTNPKSITTQGGTAPMFSPDGSQIAFVSNRDGNAEIYIMERSGAH